MFVCTIDWTERRSAKSDLNFGLRANPFSQTKSNELQQIRHDKAHAIVLLLFFFLPVSMSFLSYHQNKPGIIVADFNLKLDLMHIALARLYVCLRVFRSTFNLGIKVP